jgi:pimeloyl-ACP methyl ester carboxylesterase
VPENWSRPDGRLIQLHVAIFRSSKVGAARDPVVHLAGGPGSSSLDVASYLLGQGLNAILTNRDFILFDQRGTGYSQPRLDCPERNELTPRLLDGSLADDGASQAVVEAFRRCRDRLVSQGIDLASYTSAASAADINALRLALGYEQLNLYGDSYGTRLALTVMRDFPQAARSVVLDSTYPLEVNLYTTLAPNAERAFNVLFDECAADPGCKTAYPDLRAVFYNLVEQLNNSPRKLSLAAGGNNYSVALNGGLLIDVLFGGLYNPAVTASMPKMIYQIRQGEYAILRERLLLYFDTSSALGMGTSVQCAEEVPFGSAEAVQSAAQGVQPAIAAFFSKSNQYLFTICPDWSGQAADPRENQPVTSDTPTLILAGEGDPITPPAWGQMTASHLSHASFYEFRGQGHWVTRSSRCALSIALAFWNDPSAAPDSSCIQTQNGLYFTP